MEYHHQSFKTCHEKYLITKFYNKLWDNANLVYSGNDAANNTDLSIKLLGSKEKNMQQCSGTILKSNESKNEIFTQCTANFNKVTILNEVLQSPWTPRLPNNYQPFRRTFCDVNLAQKTENNKVFSEPDVFDGHERQDTGSPYTCLECYKSFSQLRNYKYHMSVHRGTTEFATICPICGKFFNDKGYLSSHMKIHRNRKEYKCSICPKSFNQRVAYNMHVRIHTGVKPHVCNECGKAFSRKMLLKQHHRTHSGERPYACAHCDRRFADRSNMKLHLRLHTGVKPFTCTLCPKSFTKKHHLKSHLNFHTGAKPYSCPQCQLAFTQSSNMRTHLKKCNAVQIS